MRRNFLSRLRNAWPHALDARTTPICEFDNQAEVATNFHVSVIKNSKIKTMICYTGEKPSGEKGSVMAGSFALENRSLRLE